MKYSVPDICDANVGKISALEPLLRSFGGRHFFGGKITTIKCFEDNLLLKQQLATPGRGRVIVVDGGGSLRCALLGDNLAANAVENGWAGVVIYGCVRDVDEICQFDVGIQALATNPVKPEQAGTGELDIALSFGGVTFTPGDYLYADNNGLIVSPVSLVGPIE